MKGARHEESKENVTMEEDDVAANYDVAPYKVVQNTEVFKGEE